MGQLGTQRQIPKQTEILIRQRVPNQLTSVRTHTANLRSEVLLKNGTGCAFEFRGNGRQKYKSTVNK